MRRHAIVSALVAADRGGIGRHPYVLVRNRWAVKHLLTIRRYIIGLTLS